MSMKHFMNRQSAVFNSLDGHINAFLVTNLSNIRYLCGFSGSSGNLLLEQGKAILFTDFRYQEQSTQEVGNAAEIVVYKASAGEAVLEYLKKSVAKKLGVESSMQLEIYENYKKNFQGEIITHKGIVEKVRQVKDDSEIKCLKKAFEIGDKVFSKILKAIKPGKKEKDLAAKMEYLFRTQGAEKASFDTIIAAGDRSACPHAHPTDRKVAVGEMLKIDFGVVWNGYHSDMTRTVFIGKAGDKFKKIYDIVLTAQQKAVAAIKPGIPCIDIDKIARDHITAEGFGENFGHGLGHSLGLDIHESPSFSPKSGDVLKEGMVLTVEPGIYIPGWGGVRIEDVYVVGAGGPELLTNTSNSLLELDF